MHHAHAPRLALQPRHLGLRPPDRERLLAVELMPALQLLDRHEERGERGQAQARRRVHAVLAVGRDVERRVRPLHRTRAHVQALGRVEAAREVERLAAPRLLDQRDAFLDAGPAVLAVGLEGLVVLQRAAAPDADVEPAAAHHVQHRELLGQVHRVMERQQAHAHAEPQRARAGGEERGEHRRDRAEAVVVEVVLGDPDRGVAERPRRPASARGPSRRPPARSTARRAASGRTIRSPWPVA